MNSWIFPVFRHARNPDYNTKDLYKPLKSHKADILGDKISKEWEKEILGQKTKNKQPNLLHALLRVFAIELIMTGVLTFTMEFLLK